MRVLLGVLDKLGSPALGLGLCDLLPYVFDDTRTFRDVRFSEHAETVHF